jgi:cold shock CspA family protein
MSDKGFGFIKGEDKKDYFFHRSDLNGFFEDLVQDFDGGRVIHVTFESVPSPKGPRASEVSRVDGGV